MIPLIQAFFKYEGAYIWSYRYRHALLSVFFQAFILLDSLLVVTSTAHQTVFVVLFLTLLFLFEGDTWILNGFQGCHFHHLSLVPHSFTWFIWVKLCVMSLYWGVFISINLLPWRLFNESLACFMCFLPYWIGLYGFIFVLTKGHLQNLQAGPLLLIPFQVPVILLCFSPTYLSYIYFLCAFSSTFIFAWLIGKIIVLQST